VGDTDKNERKPTLNEVVFQFDATDPHVDEPRQLWKREKREKPVAIPVHMGRTRIGRALRRR
jgi:hypothetical protein